MPKVILKNVRLSFPSLFKTEVYSEQDTGKYTATFLLDKEIHAKEIEALKAAAQQALKEKYNDKIPKGFVLPFVDGDNKDYDGYEGQISVKASTRRRPVLIDKKKSPVVEEDNLFYAGCYVNASVDFWVMDNSYGKKVLVNLLVVQFAKDGKPFGDSADVSIDDFDEIDEDDDLLA